jgi:hypothetical protein
MTDYQLVTTRVTETLCKRGMEIRANFYVQDVTSERVEWTRQYVGRFRLLLCLSGGLLELTVHVLERDDLALSNHVDDRVAEDIERICAERAIGAPPYTKGEILWNILEQA